MKIRIVNICVCGFSTTYTDFKVHEQSSTKPIQFKRPTTFQEQSLSCKWSGRSSVNSLLNIQDELHALH